MDDLERETPDGGLRTTGYALLGLLLFREETSGYELKQLADRTLRFFWFSPAMSQVYSELQRLLEAGLVSARRVPGPGRGRTTRLFRITPLGRERLVRWLEETEAGFPILKHSVALRLFFGRLTGTARVRDLLEDYAERLQGRISELQAIRTGIEGNPEFRYPAMVAEWGLRYYEAETAIVRDLAQRLAGEAAHEATPSPEG
ncbi:MAG TPA: PadR family transcriptional regulator [Candidatus Dormibacteraeota bacterium]|nr:PadR family transcriptional regulator [Candidatus Dormibacteraeota bacterium]